MPTRLLNGRVTEQLAVDSPASSPLVVFTRPADTAAYLANDVIGSATSAIHEAAGTGTASRLIQIQSAQLVVNLTSVTSGMTTFRLHLFDEAPGAIADNAPFAVAAADRTKYCGYVDLPAIAAVGGGFLNTSVDFIGRPLRLKSASFFFNLQTIGAFNTSSGTEFRVRFHCIELGG